MLASLAASIDAFVVEDDEDDKPNVITLHKPEATLESIVRFDVVSACDGYGSC